MNFCEMLLSVLVLYYTAALANSVALSHTFAHGNCTVLDAVLRLVVGVLS